MSGAGGGGGGGGGGLTTVSVTTDVTAPLDPPHAAKPQAAVPCNMERRDTERFARLARRGRLCRSMARFPKTVSSPAALQAPCELPLYTGTGERRLAVGLTAP